MNPIENAKNQFKKLVAKGQLPGIPEIDFDMEDRTLYQEVLHKWYQNIVELEFLPSVSMDTEEFLIHTPLYIQQKKRVETIIHQIDLTQEDINLTADIIALRNHQQFNYTNPFCSFNCIIKNYQFRVTLIHYSTNNENLSKIFLRKLNEIVIPIENYGYKDFFQDLINQKKNTIISGATGSGKTTFTNSLLSLLPKDEHIITIEDTKELISANPLTTSLIAQAELKNKTMKSYMSYALRMSPERMIIGEVRGEEVAPILLGLNTGHNGLITTVHANSAQDALNRLVLLFKLYSEVDISYETVLKLITKNIDYVVHIENKKIKEVIEVFSSEGNQIFFERINMHANNTFLKNA